jgi:hypothetical protein
MSIGVTADTPDPRNHAASAWLRGFGWAVPTSNKNQWPLVVGRLANVTPSPV